MLPISFLPIPTETPQEKCRKFQVLSPPSHKLSDKGLNSQERDPLGKGKEGMLEHLTC